MPHSKKKLNVLGNSQGKDKMLKSSNFSSAVEKD
jgi:hypothetical protein